MQLNLDCTVIVKVADPVRNSTGYDLIYVLSRYQASEDKTAYQVLKDAVKNDTKDSTVLLTTLMLTANGQVICAAQGDVNWLMDTEVFRTYSGFGEMQLTGIGFIDRQRKMRVAFEEGMVTIRPLKE